MTVLNLKCRGYGIGLHLPATSDKVREAVSRLTEGLDSRVPVCIDSVSGSVPEIYQYIQRADLRSETDIQNLNLLTERINSMTQEEQQLFSAVLEFEGAGGLDEAIHIADSLDRYEIFPKIKTDEDLGRFLVDTSFMTGKFSFPEAVRPYLDYAKIGKEQYDALGCAYTQHGLVRHREDAPMLEETPRAMLLTLTTSEKRWSLALPASEEQLEHTKEFLGVEDFSQAVIESVEYAAPYLDRLIPLDCIAVEDANELAHCLQEIQKDGEMMQYCAALAVEDPVTFSEALDVALNIDNYKLISNNESEYGRESLRSIGADDELLDTIDGYTDFDQLGRDMMESDGVRQTEFGLVRRLDSPFPPEQEVRMQMQ